MPIAVALDTVAIAWSSSIFFGSKLYIFKYIKCRPLLLKTLQFLLTLDYFELALGLGLCLRTTEVLILSKEF